MTTATVLVVGCGFPQRGLIRFARANELRVVGLDRDADAIGVALCDAFVQASTTDVDAICAAATEQHVDGIVSCGSEHALAPVATACERLGLPFYGDSETIARCQYKHHMRTALAAAGLDFPAFQTVETLTHAQEFVADHGLPAVIKPSFGWGQRGVRVVKQADELATAVKEALDATPSGVPAIIEAFIPGREFSVDAYTVDGQTQALAVTERIITSYPQPPGITFAEVFPASLPAEKEQELVDLAVVANVALGIKRGPTYTQMRSGEKGPAVVEVAYRLGGGLDPEVALLASGVSLYRRIVGVALGRSAWETASSEAVSHGGAIGSFIIAKPGRVVAVQGVAQAEAMTGIVDVAVYRRVGDTVEPLTDGSKRAGHVVAVGKDRQEAEQRAAAARDTVCIVTEEA